MDKKYVKDGDYYYYDTGFYKWEGNSKIPIILGMNEEEYNSADYWLKKLPEVFISGYGPTKFRDLTEYFSSLKYCPFKFTFDSLYNYTHVSSTDFSFDPNGPRYVKNTDRETVQEQYYPICACLCRDLGDEVFCVETDTKDDDSIMNEIDREINIKTGINFIPGEFNKNKGFFIKKAKKFSMFDGLIDIEINCATFANLVIGNLSCKDPKYTHNFYYDEYIQKNMKKNEEKKTPNENQSKQYKKYKYPKVFYSDMQYFVKKIPLKIENGKLMDFDKTNPFILSRLFGTDIFIETDGTSVKYTQIGITSQTRLSVYSQLKMDRETIHIRSLGLFVHVCPLDINSVILTNGNGYLMDRFFLYGFLYNNPNNYTISYPERYIFLIASHINDIRRIETMSRALKSIAVNKPDYIYVSYSVEPQFDKGIEYIEKLWENSVGDIPYLFLYQNTKKYQFEHYEILKEYVLDNDIVSFSDDDDLTDPNKIKILKENFSGKPNNPDIHGFMHKMMEFGGPEPFDEKIPDVIDNLRDADGYIRTNKYTCISLKGWLFRDWFLDNGYYVNDCDNSRDRPFSQLVEKHGNFTDILFTFSLEREHLIKIPNVLYYQRFKLNGISMLAQK
jgi:hypothetical protein